MKDSSVIVTSNSSPDLDGVACAIAYSEILNSLGNPAKAVFFGILQSEPQFIVDKFNISIEYCNDKKMIDQSVVLVDASDPRGLPSCIDPNNVIEAIDHRKVFDKSNFPNAHFDISYVGAAATQIFEKYQSNTSISLDSGILILHAIVSNTINFNASVTTERDILAYTWLREYIGEQNIYSSEMFRHKSKMIADGFDSIDQYRSFLEINRITCNIIQLEIFNADQFLIKQRKLIDQYEEFVLSEYNIQDCLISFIDLESYKNVFYSKSNFLKSRFEERLAVKFKNGIAYSNNLLMRKEIIPKII